MTPEQLQMIGTFLVPLTIPLIGGLYLFFAFSHDKYVEEKDAEAVGYSDCERYIADKSNFMCDPFAVEKDILFREIWNGEIPETGLFEEDHELWRKRNGITKEEEKEK